jgi:hypothetical protein
MEVSGERNSCETAATKSDCMRDTSRSRRTARAMKYAPAMRNSTVTMVTSTRKRFRATIPASAAPGVPVKERTHGSCVSATPRTTAASGTLPSGHHAALAVQSRAGNFVPREQRLEQDLRPCDQRRPPRGRATPKQKEGAAIHPEGVLSTETRVSPQIAPRLRDGLRPGREFRRHGLAVAGEPSGFRPIERELAARELPARRAASRRNARASSTRPESSQSSCRATRSAGAPATAVPFMAANLVISLAGFRNLPAFAQHAGQAQERAGAQRGILAVGNAAVPVAALAASFCWNSRTSPSEKAAAGASGACVGSGR